VIRIAPDARLGQAHLEDAEVAQFHSVALGEGVGDVIERALDNVEDLMLHQPVSLLILTTSSLFVKVPIMNVFNSQSGSSARGRWKKCDQSQLLPNSDL
jgi:hypothetical protein